MRGFLAAALVIGLATDAAACQRCGRSACVYRAAYVAPVVQQVKQADVFVVQNNYPQPLVAQGTSAVVSNGGYQSLTLPLFDANQYFSQELQLLKAAGDAQALRSERTSQLVERVAALQAPAVERLAAGQAARMVLQAAGLDPAHNTQGQASAVVISRDASGTLQVQQLSTDQVQRIATRTTITESIGTTERPDLAAVQGKYPMLTQFCGKCHGLDVASPKAGLYLADDANVAAGMKSKFFEIVRSVSQGQMPPAAEPQPDDRQKAAILSEIEQIVVARSGTE